MPVPVAMPFPFHGADPTPEENVPVVALNVQLATSLKFAV
jgi:hypothetical protein